MHESVGDLSEELVKSNEKGVMGDESFTVMKTERELRGD